MSSASLAMVVVLHHRIGDLENEEIFNHYHKTLHHRIGDLEVSQKD